MSLAPLRLPRRSLRRTPSSVRGLRSRERQRGQVLIIFTIAIVAIIAMAGLLVDGGMAWTNRRMAQNSADVSALAAAKTWSTTADTAQATTAARNIASSNGFSNSYTNCQGQSKNDGVTVNIPPTSGAFSGRAGYLEVVVQRPMRTSFSAIVGQTCWMVSARAAAVATSNEVASCNFCSLNNSNQNHTLILKNSAALRVDGDIYVNSKSGGYTPGVCSPLTRYKVCGDGFDIFGDGGYISAKTISTVGGWETHNKNIATADGLATGCTEHPNPPSQSQTSNVCIHMPTLADPLNDPSKPGAVVNPPTAGSPPVAGSNGCPAGSAIPSGTAASPSLMTISTNKSICPGTYYGGLKITGGTTTMHAGTYVLVGGGFQVLNSASVDARAGVLIYSESGTGASNSTNQASDLVPDDIPGHDDLKMTLVSSVNPAAPLQSVVFTVTLTPSSSGTALPVGYVDVFDGNVQICSAQPITLKQVGKNIGIATCTTTWSIWGTRAIAAVYSGDTIYNPNGANLTEKVTQPSGTTAGPITIFTTGKVDIFGQKSGPYAGLTLFQERSSDLTITLAPGDSRAGKCGGSFMTRGVPPDPNPLPDACGEIGGLQGTVYAANQDALVLIEASGMANLQVIAGQIEIDTDEDARFGFQGSLFANSSIHLVE